MSDLPMSDRMAGLGSSDAIRGVTRAWWLFLILGVLWILFGMFVLSYNVGSLLALAIFAGITFIMTGINQILASGRVEGWRWLYLVGGALSIIAGIIAFVWPGRTLLVISIVLAWFLVFKGIVDIVSAFTNHGRPYWWVGSSWGSWSCCSACGPPGTRAAPWSCSSTWSASTPSSTASPSCSPPSTCAGSGASSTGSSRPSDQSSWSWRARLTASQRRLVSSLR